MRPQAFLITRHHFSLSRFVPGSSKSDHENYQQYTPRQLLEMSVICPISLLKSHAIGWLPHKNLHIGLVLLPFKKGKDRVATKTREEALLFCLF